ncbi:hypothetical protein [Streptomyces sp. NPDC088789]|uniref:hypothetical protein n=1 Tax=Streptomyces sp. NPDC088789 TaxID=3365899 RepID=UPI003806443C
MHHVLCGLAVNPALSPGQVGRLMSMADEEIATRLAGRADLGHEQAVALAAHSAASAVLLAHEGRLTSADIDPGHRPEAALALLDRGTGSVEWARHFAADPVRERRGLTRACGAVLQAVYRRALVYARVAHLWRCGAWASRFR